MTCLNMTGSTAGSIRVSLRCDKMPLDMMEKNEKHYSEADIFPENGAYEYRYLKGGHKYGLGGMPAPRKGSYVSFSKLLRMYRPLILSFIIVMLAFVMRRYAESRREAVLDPSAVVITVSDPSAGVSLKIDTAHFCYYIRKAEIDGNKAAIEYDETDPRKYWGVFLEKDKSTSGYVSDIARQAALDSCIRDTVYAMEAGKAGFKLDDGELEDIGYDAEEFFKDLNEEAALRTGLTKDVVLEMAEKEALSHFYMLDLARKDVEKGGALSELEAVRERYDTGGTYYEELLKGYAVSIDEEEMYKIKPGRVTINNE